jgi:anti-sigma factor RsiW
MDCRETRTLLTAFHDGELPAADRARVEEHLRGCPECGALLADLARADQAAGVPDPGTAYWDRFNARVMDRVEREADGPSVAVLRPKHGWMRQPLRYLVPAAAAAALVMVVVRYGGMHPVAPTPAVPPAVSEPAAPVSAGQRMAKKDPESDGHGWPSAGAGRDATGSVAPAAGSPSVTAADGMPSGMEAEQKKMAGAAAPPEPQLAAKTESASGMRIAKDQSAAAPPAVSLGKTRSKAGPASLASAPSRDASPCELARTLAGQGRLRDAEAAQRACLAQDRSAPAQEKGLVFLAELLDRQVRFAEADAVIAEVYRQFPQSRPLDLYRQQRPIVQKQPAAVPVTR